MILSGKEIKRCLGKEIKIDPFNESQLGVNSYNLRLHDELMIYPDPILDMKKELATERFQVPEEGIILRPGQLYLGRTVESITTESFIPFLEGRSSIARLGIFVHICAGFGNIGSDGCWTLEIACIKPVRIYPNIEICQMYFQMIHGDFLLKKSLYHGNRDIRPSLLYKELNKKDK